MEGNSKQNSEHARKQEQETRRDTTPDATLSMVLRHTPQAEETGIVLPGGR